MATNYTNLGNMAITQAVLSATTAEDDILHGPGRLYLAIVHNDDSGVRYFKIWDNVNPTVGTTDPDYCHEILADSIRVIPYNLAGSTPGVAMANGLSYGGSDGAGTGAGSAPTALRVTLLTSAIE